MRLDLTDDETRALAAHLRHALEYDPFPYAPRLDPLKAILAKLEPRQPQTEPLPPPDEVREPDPPMTLGNAAAAHVRLIVWCLDCGHRVGLDPAERYGGLGSLTLLLAFAEPL